MKDMWKNFGLDDKLFLVIMLIVICVLFGTIVIRDVNTKYTIEGKNGYYYTNHYEKYENCVKFTNYGYSSQYEICGNYAIKEK